MYKMMVGECTLTEEHLEELNDLTLKTEKATGFNTGAGIAMYFPIIRHYFPDWTGRSIHIKSRDAFAKESRVFSHLNSSKICPIICRVSINLQRLLATAKQKIIGNYSEAESFTEKFALQMKKEEKTKNNPGIFKDINYNVIFADLFQASSNTTAGYMESLLLFMVLNPDVQEKVYREIKETLSSTRDITFQDKNLLIYTQATLIETHRVAKVIQFLVARKVLKDFTYKDYLIKKDILILTDLPSIYANPKLYQDAETFKPERFIGADGKLCNHKSIIPFGVGKRMCPGEMLADVASFLMFTNFIKLYKLSTIPGEAKPKDVMRVGFTSCPFTFKIVVNKRIEN